MIDIEELRKLAIAAGAESPWHWHADQIKGDPLGRSRYEITTLGRTITRTYYSDSTALNEAAFIAAANPANILALLSELEKLRADNKALSEFVIACGGFWGESRSVLVGPESLHAVIEQAFEDSRELEKLRRLSNGTQTGPTPEEIDAALESARECIVPEFGYKYNEKALREAIRNLFTPGQEEQAK